MRVELTAEEFTEVRAILDRTAGLVFDQSRRDSLCYSLGERMAACGCTVVADYLAVLQRGAGAAAEMQALLNEVTIQETHFFRNPPQFRALREHVLPALVKAAAADHRRLRIWSAGCSTGEEPYSIAMLVSELLPCLDGWDIQIVATDISTRALDAARAGRYSARSLGVADPADVARWFFRDGAEYVVRPEVRELVDFRRHNLVTDPPPFEGDAIDLILCRNVTIYFGRDTTRALMTRLHDRLVDGGYLFLGHSETLWQINDHFRLVTLGDAFVYRRDGADAAGPALRSDRRHVLPDRRTGDDGLPFGERRSSKPDRRSPRWAALTEQLALRRNRAVPDSVVRSSVHGVLAPADGELAAVRTALAGGRYEEAAELAGALAAADPLGVDPHYLCGLALSNLGRDDEALAHLRKAVYLAPQLGMAHFLLAGALARLGDARGASRSYQAAAQTLGREHDEHLATELGGRDVQELVELCWQLSGRRRPE
ncbi:MAG TPA: CheR family methyltransferase [Mycobacteriales bacterium]|nr:CheR family methyltransferase [Mycobacteriales bacterium]